MYLGACLFYEDEPWFIELCKDAKSRSTAVDGIQDMRIFIEYFVVYLPTVNWQAYRFLQALQVRMPFEIVPRIKPHGPKPGPHFHKVLTGRCMAIHDLDGNVAYINEYVWKLRPQTPTNHDHPHRPTPADASSPPAPSDPVVPRCR